MPRTEYSILNRVCTQVKILHIEQIVITQIKVLHMEQSVITQIRVLYIEDSMNQDHNIPHEAEYLPRSNYSICCRVYTQIRIFHMKQSMFQIKILHMEQCIYQEQNTLNLTKSIFSDIRSEITFYGSNRASS